jgi:hypothetical protein
MSHDEVNLLVNDWLENHSQLAVVGQLSGRSFVLERCRVVFVAVSSIELVTGDGEKIRIDTSEPGIEFKYAQPREFSEFASKHGLTEEQKLASSLIMFFPPREDGELTEENADCISLREIAGS